LKGEVRYIAGSIIRNRVYILIGLIVITVASLTQLVKLRVYNELDIWIEKTSDEYTNYKNFVRVFGNDESLMLLYHSDTLITNSQLSLIYHITDSLKTVGGVKDVISLASVKVPSSSLAGPALLPLIPKATTHPERLKDRLKRYRTYNDFLFSGDFRATSFSIIPDSDADRAGLLQEVTNMAERLLTAGGEYVIYGIIPLKESLSVLSARESKRFLTAACILLALSGYLLFRRLKEAVLSLMIALITICWTLGMMSALGISFNVVLSVLPIILLVISIANTIHFITGQLAADAECTDRVESIITNFSIRFNKCLFSSLTTAAALFAFALSDIGPLKHFGLFSSFGVLLSFMLTFTILPIIYSFSERSTENTVFSGGMLLRSMRYAQTLLSIRKSVYIISLLVLIISLAGISRVKVNTEQITYFRRDHPVRVAHEQAERWFSGVVPLEIIFNLDSSIYISPNHYISQLILFEESLSGIPEIKSWQSIVSILNDYGMIKGDRISLSGQNGRAYYASDGLFSHFVSADGKSLRTTLKTSWLNDKEQLALIGSLESIMEDIFSESGVAFYFTGTVPVFARFSSRLAMSQIRSLLFTFIVIFGMFVILYRNIRLALLCLVPNIIPVAFTLGIMGFLAIPLDVATILIASVSLGIAVDDTIHFVSTYREFLSGNARCKAIDSTFVHIGRPLITTSLLITGGFIIMIFSSYRPIAFMGLFISLNVILALISDLIVLPSILLYGRDNHSKTTTT